MMTVMPLALIQCGWNPEGSFSGKYTEPVTGLVTHYSGAEASSTAYYAPELESGWYNCAVSENKLAEIPPQSAIEITYGGKTIHVLVTDLCPNAGNSHWTSIDDYFFDLSENAFRALDDLEMGVLEVTLRMIPYPTAENIKFQVKDGSSQHWLSGRFYNMRYPLSKAEYSNGDGFRQMERLSGNKNNWWVIESGDNLTSGMKFRLTDIYGNTVTTDTLGTLSAGGKYDTGVNFPQ